MVSYYMSLLCLLVFITPAFSSTYILGLWKRPQIRSPSYDSIEYGLPYVPSKVADRSNLGKEQLEEKDKILTMLTKEKNEINNAEIFLSAILRALHTLLAKNPDDKNPMTKESDSGSIAWSYYDDIGK